MQWFSNFNAREHNLGVSKKFRFLAGYHDDSDSVSLRELWESVFLISSTGNAGAGGP